MAARAPGGVYKTNILNLAGAAGDRATARVPGGGHRLKKTEVNNVED